MAARPDGWHPKISRSIAPKCQRRSPAARTASSRDGHPRRVPQGQEGMAQEHRRRRGQAAGVKRGPGAHGVTAGALGRSSAEAALRSCLWCCCCGGLRALLTSQVVAAVQEQTHQARRPDVAKLQDHELFFEDKVTSAATDALLWTLPCCSVACSPSMRWHTPAGAPAGPGSTGRGGGPTAAAAAEEEEARAPAHARAAHPGSAAGHQARHHARTPQAQGPRPAPPAPAARAAATTTATAAAAQTRCSRPHVRRRRCAPHAC